MAELLTPSPLGSHLPAPYQEDRLAQRLLAGLDGVLAPVFCLLDNLDAYIDPHVTPPDFLEWLAGWVGVGPDVCSRESVAGAAARHRRLGTPTGLREALEAATGAAVEIIEGGATAWSAEAGGELPGRADASLVVRIRGASVNLARVEALVREVKPAHLAHRVEVVP